MTGVMRARSGAEWRLERKELPADVVQRVVRAVWRGKGLPDPVEAGLAIGCAIDWRRRMIIALWLTPCLGGVALVVALIAGASAAQVGPFVPFLAGPVATVFAWRRARQAEAVNRAVLEAGLAGTLPPPPTPGTVGDAQQEWRRRAGVDGVDPGS